MTLTDMSSACRHSFCEHTMIDYNHSQHMSDRFVGSRHKPPRRKNERLKHNVKPDDTDVEDEQPIFGSGKNIPNQSHHISTGPFSESLQSSLPTDDDLDIFSVSNSGTATVAEAFHRGPKAEQVEREGLSINIPLLTNAGKFRDPVEGKYQTDYWKVEKAEIPRFKTRLQTIDSLEYSVEELEQGKVVLSCSEGPPKKEETPNSTQIKWLHLQGATMSLDIFISLIMNCHLIEEELAAVAIRLIHKVEEKFLRDSENGPYIQPGSVLRCTGTYPQTYSDLYSQSRRPTGPIIFVASPYLNLSQFNNHRSSDNEKDEYHPRTLLQSLYGFDVSPNRDKTQIIRKLYHGKQQNDVLHVNQMWCLLIGSKILITMSEQSSDALLTGIIKKRVTTHKLPINIKIFVDGDNNYHNIAISANIAWVDLFNITLDAVKKKRSEFDSYDLRDEKKEILSAERWIDMVKIKKSQSYIFYLTRKDNKPLYPLRLLEYPPAKRRRSDGSSQDAGSVRREPEIVGATSYQSPQMEPSPDISKRTYAVHRELVGTEEREPLFEFRLGGISQSSHDPKEDTTSSTPYGLFAGYERPTVRSLNSSDKESSSDKREDTSALPVHDDTVSQLIRPRDADTQVVYRDGKDIRSRESQLPHESSVETPKFPSLDSAGNACLIGAKTNRKTKSQPNLGHAQDPRYSAPMIRTMDDSMVNGKLLSIESFDESIDLTDAGKNSRRATKRRYQQNRRGSDPSTEEDDPTEVLTPRLDNNRQSQMSLSASTSNPFTSSKRDPSQTYYDLSNNWPIDSYRSAHLGLPSFDFTQSPRERYTAHNDNKRSLRYNSKLNNRHSAIAAGLRRERQASLPRSRTFSRDAEDLTNDKDNAAEAQEHKLPNIVPFFLWGPVCSSTDQSTKETEMINSLDEAHKAISDIPLGRYYYSKIPEFTEEEFFFRQESLNDYFQDGNFIVTGDEFTKLNSGQRTDDNEKRGPVALHNPSNCININDQVKENLQRHEGKTDSKNQATQRDTHQNIKDFTQESAEFAMNLEQSLGAHSHDKALMKELVEVSHQIIRSFIPTKGGSTVHVILKRFWGSIDIICRQLIWEESERGSRDEHVYLVRDFSPAFHKSTCSQKMSWYECDSCKEGYQYNSAKEALDHLHKKHLDCQYNCTEPYDDPCYAWLHRIWPRYHTRSAQDGLLSHIKSFIRNLSEIQERIKELHAMVASREDESMGILAVRPLLPRSISYAFRQVVQIFILRSKVLSLMTRQKSVSRSPPQAAGSLRRISDKVHELQGLENIAMRQTLSFFDHAKRDIFLSGNTPGDMERRQPQSAGAEFLALAFICGGQNFLFGDNFTTARHENSTIRWYKDYTSKLHYQANRRPQKRVFLDIHDLEEELDALSTVLDHQKDCLDKFTKAISPETLRLTTATRVTQNKVESWVKDDHFRQLEMRKKEIENMKIRSKFLKEQVKQTIEILEEDHGKAIRVFTIVTLFFLPLSFVSSFLGMNTADVRNMNNNQWLFWATGIPITIFVLALACIYGYKGDEIRDWMIQRLDNPSSGFSRSEFAGGREDHTPMHEGWLPTYKKLRRYTDRGRQQPHKLQSDMRLDDSGSGSGSGNSKDEEHLNVRPSVERKETFDSLKPLPPK